MSEGRGVERGVSIGVGVYDTLGVALAGAFSSGLTCTSIQEEERRKLREQASIEVEEKMDG